MAKDPCPLYQKFLPVYRFYSLCFMHVIRKNLIIKVSSNQVDDARHTSQAHAHHIRRALGVHAARHKEEGAGTYRKVNKISLELFTTTISL